MRNRQHLLIYAFFVLIVGSVFTSCVSRKKVVYFQTGDWDNPHDTAIAVFDNNHRQYTLKEGDIVNVSLGSVTPVEFDFIAQYIVQMGEFLYLSPKTGKNGSQTFQKAGGQLPQSSAIETAYEDKQALGFVVNRNGNIALPKIGEIESAGKTISQIEKEIEQKLDGYFESPQVRVQLLNFQFTVLGEVNEEGRYTTFKEKTSLIEALTMAGNCAEFADRSQIKVIRTIGDETSIIYVDLLDAAFLGSSMFYLYPEDIIVIAPLKAKFWRQYVFPDTMQFVALLTSVLSLVALIIAINK